MCSLYRNLQIALSPRGGTFIHAPTALNNSLRVCLVNALGNPHPLKKQATTRQYLHYQPQSGKKTTATMYRENKKSLKINAL
jgi:hypothetical protein